MGKAKASKRKNELAGGGDRDSFKKFKGADGEAEDSSAAISAVNRELKEVREAALEAAEPREPDKEEQEEAAAAEIDGEEAGSDPYLMADAKYIQKDTRWKNKQRTLVMCSRGVTSQFRNLTEDLKKLLPHHKAEPKFEKSANLKDINEVCELKSCNNVIFFEARKMTDLYMYVARVPTGPTLKFQVSNIHTSSEVRMAGNCLLGSRPILHFDKHFDQLAELKLTKTMFVQAFGTPRNHPKSKPFHDHIMTFHYMDRKIIFRHYQIAPETIRDDGNPEAQVLTEIGPRFTLDPIRFLNGSFTGQTMFLNPHYLSPTALRVQAKKLQSNPYRRKLENRADRKQLIEDTREEEDPTEEAFT